MVRHHNLLTDWTLVPKRRVSKDHRICDLSSQRFVFIKSSGVMVKWWMSSCPINVALVSTLSSVFVRFKLRAEALNAIQDLHGILTRDFHVQVNLARFSQGSNYTSFKHKPNSFPTNHGHPLAFDYQEKTTKSKEPSIDKNLSFADILIGKRPPVTTASIMAWNEGDQWLSMSVVVKLPSQMLIEPLREAFIVEGVWNVQS